MRTPNASRLGAPFSDNGLFVDNLPLLLPADLSGALFRHPDDQGQEPRNPSILPGVLRMGRASVHRRSALLDRLQLPCGPGHRRSGRRPSQSRAGGRGCGKSSRSRRLQIREFRHRQYGRLASASRLGGRDDPYPSAARNLLLHLPLPVLCHRHLPETVPGQSRSDRRRALYLALSAIGRGAHRSLQDRRPPIGRPPVHAWPRFGRRPHFHHWPCAEGAGGRCRRAARTGRVRSGSRPLFDRGMDRTGFLHDPDLFRLRRLFQHGDRAWHRARVHLPAQFPHALYVVFDHRILAPLAHVAVVVAARLSLYPAWRQPRLQCADLPQPHNGVPAVRPLAWGKLDLCSLGRLARRLSRHRARGPQIGARPVGAASSLGLCAARRHGRVGPVSLRGPDGRDRILRAACSAGTA